VLVYVIHNTNESQEIMSEWQPIETAPRDGTEVFCFIPEHNWGALKVGEDYKLLSFIQDVGWVNRAYHNEKPTHWMPLPPPPTTESK
jgi:hypothetical protein